MRDWVTSTKEAIADVFARRLDIRSIYPPFPLFLSIFLIIQNLLILYSVKVGSEWLGRRKSLIHLFWRTPITWLVFVFQARIGCGRRSWRWSITVFNKRSWESYVWKEASDSQVIHYPLTERFAQKRWKASSYCTFLLLITKYSCHLLHLPGNVWCKKEERSSCLEGNLSVSLLASGIASIGRGSWSLGGRSLRRGLL